MKKLLSFVLSCFMAGAMNAQTVDGRNFGIDGFAAYAGTPGTNHYLAGGTTGGAGGEVVKAENFAQLQAYLQSSKPYIVLVDHDITTGIPCYVESLSTGYLCQDQSGESGEETTYGERVMVASNKTLIGIVNPKTGKAPLFSRITFVLQCQSNVIIRNCRFTMVGAPIIKTGENKIVAWRDGAQKEVGDPDCIGIQADKTSAKTDYASHIWIDHCEFFNGNAANKDRYDGLVDCKNNVQWLTISYNLFHDHDKACLWGKGDSDVFEGCRTISAHHNWFKDIQGSRLPLQRGGHVHYMNNYQEDCQDGWDLRSQSVGYADACYFKGGKAPILPDGGGVININTEEGYGIIYDNCTRRITGHAGVTEINISKTDKEFPASQYVSGTWVPTDTWSEYFVNSHDKAEDVPVICEQYSGAGKIVIWDQAVPSADETKYYEAVATQLTAACYDENGNKVSGVSGGVEESDPSGDAEVLFKLEISSSASDLSISKASDVKDLASYCSTLTGGSAKIGLRADAVDDQGKAKTQKVIGADSKERHIRTPKNDVYVMITLSKPLAVGDKISFTGNGNSSLEICMMANNTYSNAEATTNHLYTIPETSSLVGKTTLYVSRATSSNTYIQTITIMRPDNDDDTPTAISEVQEAKKFNSSSVQKAIVDGKLVIIKDGKQFNAAGAQVQ